MKRHPLAPRLLSPIVVVLAVLLPGLISAQTRIVPPANKYSLADDVKLGQDAAAEARKELPLMTDRSIDDWVESIGRRLAAAAPPALQHPEFHYTFEEVNQKEINAFALPGGPMFLNRGMIEAAKSEGEVAGVMAHEMSHVLLRHGTAQATKGEKFQLGAVAGQVLGAIIGGTAGSVIAQGSQFGLGAYFMKFSREYESQADLLGAQIMARAGYDPREMANMFKTIEAEGGGGGPEWLSSHPDPGNRYAAITREAQSLQVTNPVRDTGEFTRVKARLAAMPPAYTAAQIEELKKNGQIQNGVVTGTASTAGSSTPTAPRAPVAVAAPATQYRTYQAGSALRVSVPANWQQHGANSTVTYAPDGAYVQSQSGNAFTHGVQVGITQGTGDLQRDTDALVRSLTQTNPAMRRDTSLQRDRIGGRSGLTVGLRNTSEVTGQSEQVQLSTVQLRDNSLLYLIGVAPEAEAARYAPTFARVRQLLRINDR
jgi:Zn-dependent protease with chaperone function